MFVNHLSVISKYATNFAFLPDADSVDSSSVVSCDSLISIEDSDSDNSDNPSLISNTPIEPDGCDYGLNGDNLDWLKRPSIYSKDRDSESVHQPRSQGLSSLPPLSFSQRQWRQRRETLGTRLSVHWFNLLAYDNRVADWNLSDEEPIRNIMELPNSSFLPSPEEHAKLKKDFVLLVLRILAKNCKYFRQFGSMIPSHIPHQYSINMSRQSQIVGLNVCYPL